MGIKRTFNRIKKSIREKKQLGIGKKAKEAKRKIVTEKTGRVFGGKIPEKGQEVIIKGKQGGIIPAENSIAPDGRGYGGLKNIADKKGNFEGVFSGAMINPMTGKTVILIREKGRGEGTYEISVENINYGAIKK
jgi:hypothetical protein